MEQLTILKVAKEKPSATQKEIASAVGKSERTIRRRMTELREKGYLHRKNGKRNGHWEIPTERIF